MQCHTGKHQVGQEAQGGRGKGGQEFLLCSPWERMGEAEEAELGLTSLNNIFSGLWSTGHVPNCLLSGPGVVRAGGQWPTV